MPLMIPKSDPKMLGQMLAQPLGAQMPQFSPNRPNVPSYQGGGMMNPMSMASMMKQPISPAKPPGLPMDISAPPNPIMGGTGGLY